MVGKSVSRRQRDRLKRILPCLGKDFVMIPVLFPDLPSDLPHGRKFRNAVLAAGAVEVVHGRVRESDLMAALDAEIRAGHLPEDARKLAPHIDEMSVFCRVCAEDIRHVIERIELEEIPNLGPLLVEDLFIGYKKFKKGILYLDMLGFECSSPRHSRPSHAEPDSVSTDKSSKNLWQTLDEKIAEYYQLDHSLTELGDTTYHELICTVYRLFVNKSFILMESCHFNGSEGNPGICGVVDCSNYSTVIVTLLKMLEILKAKLSLHFSQPSAVLDKLITCSDLCKEEMGNILMIVKDMDIDGSFSTFVSELGLEWADIFHFTILSLPGLKHELESTILGLIEGARSHLVINRKLLRDSIEVLKRCSLFDDIVERPYFISLSRHYSCLSSRLIRTLDAGEYLEKVESCVKEEDQLATEFIGVNVGNEITIRILKEMVGDHITRLVDVADSHLCQLISAGRYDDISRMFKLVRKLPEGYASLSTALTNYMRKSLTALVADKQKQTIEYIQLILEERDRYERIIMRSLGKDMQLISKACFILREISGENFQLAEYVSLYMDRELVQVQDDCQAANAALDKALTLVGDFDNKAAFQIYYQRHLADRLLSGTYSEKMEMSVLTKLRGHCCPHYLKKLELMVIDIKTSQEVMTGFCQINSAEGGIPFCARILTANAWPSQPFTVCSLPSELMESWSLFCAYYLSLHCGRRLDWYPSLGDATVTAKFGGSGREHELILPMYHTCVLMLFNSAESLTFGEILKKTGIPRSHLIRCLFSLTCVEGKNVLCKEPKGQITRKDRFCVNDSLSSENASLKFDTVVALKSTEVLLDEEKTNVMDSVIVKMLKESAATGLRFNSIVKGLAGLLKGRFRITPRAVQRRLDSLVQWEHVVKEERDGAIYFRYNP